MIPVAVTVCDTGGVAVSDIDGLGGSVREADHRE